MGNWTNKISCSFSRQKIWDYIPLIHDQSRQHRLIVRKSVILSELTQSKIRVFTISENKNGWDWNHPPILGVWPWMHLTENPWKPSGNQTWLENHENPRMKWMFPAVKFISTPCLITRGSHNWALSIYNFLTKTFIILYLSRIFHFKEDVFPTTIWLFNIAMV